MMPKRRTIFTVVVFLLLGAAVNVAVAWGSVIWDRVHAIRGSNTGGVLAPITYSDHQNWSFYVERMPSVVLVSWRQEIASSLSAWSPPPPRPEWSSPPAVFPEAGDHFVNWVFIEVGAGWPAIALVGRVDRDPSAGYVVGRTGILADRLPSHGRPKLLPLRPVWPGFAINTSLYSAVIWLLLPAPFVARHRRIRRIKRGLCPACAYPVGTSPVCTECGKPVTARSVEPMT